MATRDLVDRRETVLLVEDREEVRRAIGEYLAHIGYAVVVAPASSDALAILKNTHVDVLLTDVQMPGGLGTDLADAARAIRPELRVVLMSGYAPDPAMRRRMGLLDAAFLQKPFAPTELVSVLRTPRN